MYVYKHIFHIIFHQWRRTRWCKGAYLNTDVLACVRVRVCIRALLNTRKHARTHKHLHTHTHTHTHNATFEWARPSHVWINTHTMTHTHGHTQTDTHTQTHTHTHIHATPPTNRHVPHSNVYNIHTYSQRHLRTVTSFIHTYITYTHTRNATYEPSRSSFTRI